MGLDKIKENLERYYRSVIEIAPDDKGFFLIVGDYVYYVDKTPVLNKLALEVITKRNKKAKEFNENGSEVIKEIRTTAQKILESVKKNEVTKDLLDKIEKLIEEIDDYISGKIQSTAPVYSGAYHNVANIIELLQNNSFKDLISNYSKNSEITGFPELIEDAISPSLKNHRKLEVEFKEEEEVSIWKALNNLILAYEVFFRGHKYYNDQLIGHGNFFEKMGIGSLLGERRKIMGEIDAYNKKIIQFEKNKYIADTIRVHNYLMRELSKLDETSYKNKNDVIKESLKDKVVIEENKSNQPYCESDNKWGYLRFGKYSEKIKIGSKNSQPFRLLQCLINPLGTAKSVDSVFESIRETLRKKSKTGSYSQIIDKPQKVKLIIFAIKSLQKNNKLRGKLEFKWGEMQKNLRLEMVS